MFAQKCYRLLTVKSRLAYRSELPPSSELRSAAMTTLAQIELATERAIVAELVIGLLRTMQKQYFPKQEFLDATELALVGAHVFLAQQERRRLCNVTVP